MQSGWVTKCPARDGLARLTLIPVSLGHAAGEARDRVDPEDFVTRPSTPAEKEVLLGSRSPECGQPRLAHRVACAGGERRGRLIISGETAVRCT